MSPLPRDKPEQEPPVAYRFWFNIIALLVGAVLLVLGGMNDDAATQTAGGAIMATVVGVIGWQKLQAPRP